MIALQHKLNNLLIEPFNDAQFNQRNDWNILYVSCETSGANFYRILNPYNALPNTSVVSTALTYWMRYNPQKRFSIPEEHPALTEKQLIWANTIVIPFITQPISEFVQEAKMINPEVIICYHVELDFINIPDKNPIKTFFSDEVQKTIIDNITIADKVIVTTPLLATYLLTYMQEVGIELDKKKLSVQLLLADSPLFLENVDMMPKDKAVFTLTVLATNWQMNDIDAVLPMLKNAKKKHGKALKIVFFGINKNADGFDKKMKGLEYIPEKPVPIWEYYKKLNEINSNAVLIPSDASEWTQRSADYKRFIDSSILKTPIITKNVAPYNLVATQNETSFLYDTEEQFLSLLDKLIADPAKAEAVGISANTLIIQNFSFTNDKLQKLIDLYSPTA